MCQATGTPPHLKYEADGGPGLDRVLDLLGGSARRDEDRRAFFQSQVIFWMLSAPDGHAKNFSIALRAGGGYAMTPFYDVMSAYPLLGEGPSRISAHRIKLAMAVRTKNTHWKMKEVQRRHWIEVGRRNGVVSPTGTDAETLVDDLVQRTPAVVEEVAGRLLSGFPAALADQVLGGLSRAAQRIAAS
jgi:serine/threonine-protein kinase HipA